jgi:hypothetical protein
LAHFFIGASPWCPGADEENGCAGTTLSADGLKGAGVSSAGAHWDNITTSAISQRDLCHVKKENSVPCAGTDRERVATARDSREISLKNLTAIAWGSLPFDTQSQRGALTRYPP